METLLKVKKEISKIRENEKKTKRSLLPFIGNALNTMFGVATDAQVENERDRISKWEIWAGEMGIIMRKIINDQIITMSVMRWFIMLPCLLI